MEFAGDPTFESIFTSRKVTNIFESLSGRVFMGDILTFI